MNRKQTQLEVCKALLDKSKTCRGHKINEKEIAVTVDGFTAYVFDITECVFDTTKLLSMPNIKDFLSENAKDIEITKSKKLFESNGRIIEKYIGEGIELYAFADNTKHFKGLHLFANSPLSRVIARDDFGSAIGLFLPVRYAEKTN